MRYGLGADEPKTLDEVGRHFNVTRERIRQIETKALAKMRHPANPAKLRRVAVSRYRDPGLRRSTTLSPRPSGSVEQFGSVGLHREMGLAVSGSAPSSFPMEDLTVPEDHPAPDSPIESFLQRHLQAGDANCAAMADRLGGGQVLRSFGEEQLVLSAVDAISVL